MDDDADDPLPPLQQPRSLPLSSPRTQRTHRPSRSGASRLSASSSITTLPEYTTSPPSSAGIYARGSGIGGMKEPWAPVAEESDALLPRYRSPPPVRASLAHRSRASMSKIPPELETPPPPISESLSAAAIEQEEGDYVGQYTATYSPRTRRAQHRPQPSSSSGRRSVTTDSELDDRLDQLVERSVAALEMSNRLLSHSIRSGSGRSTPTSPPSAFDRPRSTGSGRSRREERRNVYGRQWAEEHIMEEDEDDESAWEASSNFTGSLSEPNYLSAAYRPTLPRMASYGSLSGRSDPSMDGYQFPPHFANRSSPALSSSTVGRSATRTPTRPPPLPLSSSAADLGAPQVSVPSFHPSTPAYKLVSEIVSREALHRRTPANASGSQPPTPQSAPLARSASVISMGKKRDKSADPPAERRLGTLTPSISVPQDIGRWIRSLEPRSSARPAPVPPQPSSSSQEIVAPIPTRPKVISPQLPPSPPRTGTAMSLPTSPPSTSGEEPPHMSRTISQLKAILSTQPAPEPVPVMPKRPQFRPMTPQAPASAVITRPPPTPRAGSIPPQETPGASTSRELESPIPSPVPSAIRRPSALRHDKHVSFSPTPTEIPSRATSPPPHLPDSADPMPGTSSTTKPSRWDLMSWLLPSSGWPPAAPDPKKGKEREKKQRQVRAEEELAGLWRARSWMQEGRQGWGERVAESWQV